MKPTFLFKALVFISPFLSVEAGSPFHDYGELRLAVSQHHDSIWTSDEGDKVKKPLTLCNPDGFYNSDPERILRPFGSVAIDAVKGVKTKRLMLVGGINPDKWNKTNPVVVFPERMKLINSFRKCVRIKFSLWELDCKQGYVALGHVATKTDEKPDTKGFYCVRKDFVERGTLKQTIWDDTEDICVSHYALEDIVPKASTTADGSQNIPLYASSFQAIYKGNRPAEVWTLSLNFSSNAKDFSELPPKFPDIKSAIAAKGKVFNETRLSKVTLPLTALFPPDDPTMYKTPVGERFATISTFMGWYVPSVIPNDTDEKQTRTGSITYGVSTETTKHEEQTGGLEISAGVGIKAFEFGISLNRQLFSSKTEIRRALEWKVLGWSHNSGPRSTLVTFAEQLKVNITTVDKKVTFGQDVTSIVEGILFYREVKHV
ncbi:hypothetical protein PT974_10875 [Cladobotryum mycophilum]|uniref:Uncharacterized protein n=1 Tax=Cladobotryum mycophilum TaxID=491253 RepID=A0ABR0SC00_9HYPO